MAQTARAAPLGWPFVHPTSDVGDSVIGRGTKVWHWCHVHHAVVGRRCVIGQGCYVGPGVRIGNGVKLENHVSVFSGVTIEDDVFVGPSAVFTNDRNPRAFLPKRGRFEETLVQRGATIGANATIRCGVTIGKYAAVGAGSVVTGDVPPFMLYCGNPARFVRVIDKEFSL